jgi:7-cyano-7-deazaguanine synthase in queuosine biosynthesis
VQLGSQPARKRDLVLITTGKAFNAQLKEEITEFGYRTRQVSVPFSIRRRGLGFELREQSFRTRALTFQSMAAVAASQSEGNIVVVPENGQGSIGPWLTVTGQEAPDLRTHPIFTSLLSEWLEAVLERPIRFEHPHIWETKGETIHRLVSNNIHAGWAETFSCAVQARQQRTKGRRVQCGLCPNCILRRQSLLAAGLHESDAKYDRNDIITRRQSDQGLRKRVAQGLLPLIEFAQVRATPVLSRTTDLQIARFSRVVADDANARFSTNVRLGCDEMRKRTNSLVETHRSELAKFLSRQSESSLLRQVGEVLL